MKAKHTGVVFDLGGVLIDWNPRHLYRKLFADEADMERFLADVCNSAWNLEQDRGRGWAEACALLSAQHPEKTALIDAYRLRWREMLAGPIGGSVEILRELKSRDVSLFALTNWSYETFPFAMQMYDFLGWFEAIVVSGQERLVKPDPRIYRLLSDRHGLDLSRLVYIDDNPRNADAATVLGMHGIHFTGAPALRRELISLGLLEN
ncbi:MAG: HAD family hydrolase [Acetobacteraceae bacterium]